MQDVWAIDGKETEAIRVESPILPFKTLAKNEEIIFSLKKF